MDKLQGVANMVESHVPEFAKGAVGSLTGALGSKGGSRTPSPSPPETPGLAPVYPPLGLFPNFYAREPTTMVLKEKILSLSRDDFGVKDKDGNVICRCKGKPISIHDRKVISDEAGNVLFELREKKLSVFDIWIGEDASGKEIFRVRKHFSIGTKMKATFENADKQPIPGGKDKTTISVRGGFWAHSADLTLGEDGDGPVVARIQRKIFAKSQLGGQQTYYVTVAPGVDQALIAAICICFDEAKHD